VNILSLPHDIFPQHLSEIFYLYSGVLPLSDNTEQIYPTKKNLVSFSRNLAEGYNEGKDNYGWSGWCPLKYPSLTPVF
jgi:hypothetical protein